MFQCLLRDSVPSGSLRVNKAVKAIRWTGGGTPLIQTVETFSTVGDVEEFAKGENRTKYCANNNLISRKNLEEETAELIGYNNKNSERSKHSMDIMQNQINCHDGTKQTDDTEQEEKLSPDGGSPDHSSLLKSESDGTVKSDFDVRIECEDGDVFYADHVIVTSSIGFLKSNPDFFQPPLTPQHQAAINSMGFGNVSKIFLLWETGEGSALQDCLPCHDMAADWQRRTFGADVEGMIPLWLDGVQPELKSAKSSKKMSVGITVWDSLLVDP